MSPQDKCALSFYREIEPIGASDKVMLVRHSETGQLCVKKTLHRYNRDLYQFLKDNCFDGIPQIYECVQDGDAIIVVEEYISGITLRRYLTENGSMPEKKAKRIVGEICDILRNLHETSFPIVCRDLKPENIILDGKDKPVIIDFDSAKFIRKETSDTVLLGTPGYAAPEQFGFAASDERTDIYAMGVILNELLTGSMPQERVAQGRLGKLVRKSTSLDPKLRPKSIREFRTQLNVPVWTPPGFRSLEPSNMFIGTIGYIANAAFTFYIWYSNRELQFSSGPQMAIMWMMFFLWTVAYGFDYLGMRTKMPVVRNIPNRPTRILIYAVIWFVGFIAIGSVVSVVFAWIEEVFGSGV